MVGIHSGGRWRRRCGLGDRSDTAELDSRDAWVRLLALTVGLGAAFVSAGTALTLFGDD